MTKKNLFLIFCTVFISACSIYGVNYEETTTAFYPPKKSSLEVKYIENITSPHEVIGFVTINTERRQQMSEIIEKMKREAAVLGGDAAIDEVQLLGFFLENESSDFRQLFTQLLEGLVHGRAAHRGAAAAKSADAVLDDGRVAVNHVDVVHRDSELVGGDLSECGFLALAVWGSAGEDGDLSGRFDLHRRALPAAGRRRR